MFNSFPSQVNTSLYISLRLNQLSHQSCSVSTHTAVHRTHHFPRLGLMHEAYSTSHWHELSWERFFFQGLFSAGNTLTKASMNTIVLHHIRVVMKPLSWPLSTSTTAEHQPSTQQERSLGGCSSPEGQQRFPKPMPRSTDEAAASSLQKTNTFWGPTSPSRFIHLRARTSSRLTMSSKNGGYLWCATRCL